VQVRLIHYNVRDYLSWSSILTDKEHLITLINCLDEGVAQILNAVVGIILKRQEASKETKSCKMELLIGEFGNLSNALEGLVNTTSGLIYDREIQGESRQQMDTPVLACVEIGKIYKAIWNDVSNMVSEFNKFTEIIVTPPEYANSEALVNKDAIEPLLSLYLKLVDLGNKIDELIIRDEQYQICRKCQKEVINENLTNMRDFIQGLATAVIDLKNAFLSKYCCKNIVKTVAQTDYLAQIIATNMQNLAQHRFTTDEVYLDVYASEIDGLVDSLALVNRCLTRILSIRDFLPTADPVYFCSMAKMCPFVEELNDSLKQHVLNALSALLGRIGIECTSAEEIVFDEEICPSFCVYLEKMAGSFQRISANTLSILQEVAKLELIRSPARTRNGGSVVQNALSVLGEMSELLYELYASVRDKKICMNCACTNEYQRIYDEHALITRTVSDVHSYLLENRHLDVAMALKVFLESYGVFSSMLDSLHLVGSIDALINSVDSPYFGQFLQVINSWNRGFDLMVNIIPEVQALVDGVGQGGLGAGQAELGDEIGVGAGSSGGEDVDPGEEAAVGQGGGADVGFDSRAEAWLGDLPIQPEFIQVHTANQDAFIQKLSNVTLAINDTVTQTQDFLRNALGQTVQVAAPCAMDTTLRQYIRSAITRFDEFTANAAEAMQWFYEHCLYLNVKAHDANTLAAIGQLVDIAHALRPVEAFCSPVPVHGITDFSNAVSTLRDALTPEESNVVQNLNYEAALFRIAAQNLSIRSSDISDVDAYTGDVNSFFEAILTFAQWVQQARSGGLAMMLQTLPESPIVRIQEITRRISQNLGNNNDVQESISNTGNARQAAREFATSINMFTRETFNFVCNMSSVHVDKRVELNLRIIATVPTAIVFLKNNLAIMLNGVARKEIILDSIDNSCSAFAKIVDMLRGIQDTVLTMKLHDLLNRLTCDGGGTPVIERVFVPLYDTDGMPLRTIGDDGRVRVLSGEGSVLSTTGGLVDAVRSLYQQVFS
jgi:hypothetical protein